MKAKAALFTVLVLLAMYIVTCTVRSSVEWSTIKQERHRKTCLDARVEFFSECLSTTTRPYCEWMWAGKNGHVFSYIPTESFADEIDCSSEVK